MFVAVRTDDLRDPAAVAHTPRRLEIPANCGNGFNLYERI